MEKQNKLSGAILSCHPEVSLPWNYARIITSTFLRIEQVKWNMSIQENSHKLCRTTAEIQEKNQHHIPALGIQAWFSGQSICLPIHYANKCYTRPLFLIFLYLYYKRSKTLKQQHSLTPCHFQVSPGMYYFQEQHGTHCLEKSHGQLTTWLTFTSKKLWKGREQFQWNLPSLTCISWAHKDNKASPGKTGSWKFCKRVFMLSYYLNFNSEDYNLLSLARSQRIVNICLSFALQ